MSWYSKPYLIFFLYIAPTLFTVIAVFYFMLPRHKKVSEPSSTMYRVDGPQEMERK